MNKILLFSLGILAAVTLISCGGGGGGGDMSGGGNGSPVAPPATAALQISAPTSAVYSNPKIVFSNDGKAVAVWEMARHVHSWTPDYYSVMYAFYDGASWSQEAVVANDAFEPQVATNGTDFMIVYYNFTDNRIYAISSSNTGTLGTPTLLQSTLYQAYDPQIASNGSGYAVTWNENFVYANIYNGSSWGTATALGGAAGYYPKIASSGAGYAVTWQGSLSIYASIYDGAAWGSAARIDTDTEQPGSPEIASMPTGTGYAVAWYQSSGSWGVFANIYSGTTWTSPTQIEAGGKAPSIASNGTGYAVTFVETYFAAESIYAKIYNGTWGTSTRLENVDFDASKPRIASNGTSYAVTWQQSDGTTDNTYVSRHWSGSSWYAAEAIDSGSADAQTPAITRKGTGYGAIWVQNDPAGNSNIYTNTYAGSWGTPAGIVSTLHGNGSEQQKMATNKSGITLAVWRQYRNSIGNVYGSLHDTTNWSAPFLIAENADAPAVATNGTDFMISYVNDADHGVYTRPYSSKGSLGSATLMSTSGKTGYIPQIASNGTGYTVVWKQSDTRFTIYANIFNGTAWTGSEIVDGGSGSSDDPRVASNGSGYAVAWEGYNSGYNISVNIYNGSSWGGAQVLDSVSTDTPIIASNGSGYAVIWRKNLSTYARVYSNSSWGSVTSLEAGAGFCYNPRIASNGSGYAVSWQQVDASIFNIHARVYTGGSWGSDLVIDTAAGDANNPEIAGDATGYAVVWEQLDASVNKVYGNKYSNQAWGTASALDNDASKPYIYSNGAGYSAIWKHFDLSGIDNIWAKLNF